MSERLICWLLGGSRKGGNRCEAISASEVPITGRSSSTRAIHRLASANAVGKGTKREAQTRCAQLITEAEGGAAVDPSRITVAAFLDRFERDWIALDTTARTAERYAGSLAHVRHHLGDRRLQALRPADLAALYA